MEKQHPGWQFRDAKMMQQVSNVPTPPPPTSGVTML